MVKPDSAERRKQLLEKAWIGIWGTCFFQDDVRQLLLEETVQWVLLTTTAAYWRPSLSSDKGHKQGRPWYLPLPLLDQQHLHVTAFLFFFFFFLMNIYLSIQHVHFKTPPPLPLEIEAFSEEILILQWAFPF